MYANFTEETCTGTGNTLALAGATTNRIQFSKTFADGDLVNYVLEDSAGTILIAGTGVYVSATDDITRNDTWNWNGTVVDHEPTTNITLAGGTHTVRCDVIGNGLKGTYQAISNNEYISGGAYTTGQNRTIALVADTVYVMPYIVDYYGDYDNVRFRVESTGTATKARVALFSMDADGTLGSQIEETGDITISSTGEKINAFLSTMHLKRINYYIAIVANGTATVGALQDSYITPAHLWGLTGNFSTRNASMGTATTSSGWTTFPAITAVGTLSQNKTPGLALVAL